MPSYSANEAKVPYPTPSASPPPTLKRKRPSSPAPPNKKARTSPAGISHILQREFEAHLRGDRYKAKYHAGRSKSQALLHENDVLLKRVRESEELEGQVEVLRARNEEARRTSEAVHEQTTRDIVEAREAAKEARRQAEEYEKRVRCDAEEYRERVRRDAEEYGGRIRRDAEAYVREHAQTVVHAAPDDEQLRQSLAQLQAHNDSLTSSLSTTSSSLSSAQQTIASFSSFLETIQGRYTRAIHAFAVHFYIKYPMDWERIVRNFRPLAEALVVGSVSEAYQHPPDVRWDVKPDRGEEEEEETTLERAEGGVEEEEGEEEMEEDEETVSQPQSSFVQPQPAPGTTYDRARDPRLSKAADSFLDDMAGMLPGFGQQQSASGSGFRQQSSFAAPSAFGQPASTFVAQPVPTPSSFGQPSMTPAFSAPSSTSASVAQPAPAPSAFERYTAGAASAFSSQAAPTKPAPSPETPVQRQPNSKEYNTSGYATE